MKTLREIFETIYYSLPVQLLVVQVRFQKFVLFFWLFFFLTITGNFGEMMGVPYLFLEPEYMGEVNFFSMFLIGCGLGTFVTAYMISTYISQSYRFHFLAMESRPFLLFYYNNLLVPFLFVVTYSICFINFQVYLRGGFEWEVLGTLSGVFLGLFMVTLLILLYFFQTNRNFMQVFGEKATKNLKPRRVILAKARSGMGEKIRVDYYLSGLVSVATPNQNEPAQFRKLVSILNQNHGNALFLELILLLVIIGLGVLEQNPVYQIPAGTSIFFFFSIMLMLISAFTFWFRKVGPLVMLVLVVGYLFLDRVEVMHHQHAALGMNYEIPPAEYSLDALNAVSTKQIVYTDIANTLKTLDNWKADYQAFHGPNSKPKAVLICTSGGGLRSAYFTTRIMQKLDSVTNGGLMESTRLITGASGGMIGAAYYRELHLKKKLGEIENIWAPKYGKNIAKDLLNRISLKIVSSMFMPTAKEWVGGSKYDSDRGWSFDDQLIANLGVFENRRLGDYVSWEENALIPQMIFSPVVINDGRRLYISAIPASYLTREYDFAGNLKPGISGIDFRRYFKKQDADSLLFATALRMNASFPMITPYVRMPSNPPIETIDAGVADNYGLETARRYMLHMADWYRENTSGVLLLQIRDSRMQSMELPEYRSKNTVMQILDPIGVTYSAYYMSNDLSTEQYVSQMDKELEGKLAFTSFQYEPADSGGLRASLSWHLTPREVNNIEKSLANDINKKMFEQVKDWLQED